jgi:hypothetical protein
MPLVRLVLLAVATVLLAAVPAQGGSGRLTAAKAERLVKRKAELRYDGGHVTVGCHRARRGYACPYVVTRNACQVANGTATVTRRHGGRTRIALGDAVQSFCDSG